MRRRLFNHLTPLQIMTLAILLAALTLCFAEQPAPAAAQPASAMGQAFLAAFPKLGDLPGGYDFKLEDSGVNNLSATSSGAYLFWTGKRPYTWYVPSTHYNASSYDFIRIACYGDYREDLNDSYAEWSPEKFRAVRLSWDEKGKNSQQYDGLPGGVIVRTEENDGQVHFFRRLYFWKSRGCTGDIYIQYTVGQANGSHPPTPSFDARVAEGRNFCDTQIERLAKLMHSRFPEGQAGSSRFVPGGPASSPGNQQGQSQAGGSTGTDGGEGTVPDAALPAAAGATALIGGLGALGAAMANGVNPKEALAELAELFRGRVSQSGAVPDAATVQAGDGQEAYDRMVSAENLRQLQDDVDRSKDAFDRRQQYIDSLRQAGRMDQANTEAATLGELQREVSRTQQQLSDFGGQEAQHSVKQNTFDIGEDQIARARADVAAQQAGTLSDLERVKLDDWIEMQAPDEQTAARMRAVVQERTVALGGGRAAGSFQDISRKLGQVLQQSSQPDLSYVERFSIRDELMDNAKTMGDARGKAQDAAGTLGGLVDVMEGSNVKVAGDVKMGDITGKLDAVAKVSDGLGYMEGYMKGAGDSAGYAAVKAAAQMGIKQLAFRNPVIGLGDTAFKYAETALLGRDASPGKAVETLVNIAFDTTSDVKDRVPVTFNSATGKFEMGAQTLDTVSPGMTERAARNMLSAVEKQLANPDLSAADRDVLADSRSDILQALGGIQGQQGGPR